MNCMTAIPSHLTKVSLNIVYVLCLGSYPKLFSVVNVFLVVPLIFLDFSFETQEVVLTHVYWTRPLWTFFFSIR